MSEPVDKGAKVARWEDNLARPEAALRQVGAMMTAESQRSFKMQRFGEETWGQRRPINVFGIIADFYEGKKPPERRFERRPALRDTGRLASSITWRIVGQEVVEVGSNLPYAAVHNYGGTTESKPINQQVRTMLAKWLKTGKGKQYRKSLGWILNKKFEGKTLKSKVPPRPFVGITKQTISDVQEAVAVKIMEAD